MEHHGPAYKPPTTTWWWWLLCCYALNKQPKKIYIREKSIFNKWSWSSWMATQEMTF